MKISHDDYLRAKGLYHLSREAYVINAPKYHESMIMLLRLPFGNMKNIISAVYIGGDFDDALKLDGIEVDEEKWTTQKPTPRTASEMKTLEREQSIKVTRMLRRVRELHGQQMSPHMQDQIDELLSLMEVKS